MVRWRLGPPSPSPDLTELPTASQDHSRPRLQHAETARTGRFDSRRLWRCKQRPNTPPPHFPPTHQPSHTLTPPSQPPAPQAPKRKRTKEAARRSRGPRQGSDVHAVQHLSRQSLFVRCCAVRPSFSPVSASVLFLCVLAAGRAFPASAPSVGCVARFVAAARRGFAPDGSQPPAGSYPAPAAWAAKHRATGER